MERTARAPCVEFTSTKQRLLKTDTRTHSSLGGCHVLTHHRIVVVVVVVRTGICCGVVVVVGARIAVHCVVVVAVVGARITVHCIVIGAVVVVRAGSCCGVVVHCGVALGLVVVAAQYLPLVLVCRLVVRARRPVLSRPCVVHTHPSFAIALVLAPFALALALVPAFISLAIVIAGLVTINTGLKKIWRY